jgi:RNA polymerase sigma-70 factor, ECF subfamily
MELDRLETDELLQLAGDGNEGAVGPLFARHRDRLRRLVAARLDRRVAARLDPSDVVQDALGEASEKLAAFVRDRPVSFYTWLKRLTLVRLSGLHRFHLGMRKRSAARDLDLARTPAAGSSATLFDVLADTGTTPSENAVRNEECELVRNLFDRLDPIDRTFLELRYVERLSMAEIGERLGLSASAVKMRHVRALSRFRGLLEGHFEEPAS